ncbi:energy transducer TonB [Fusobacterium perfoetens]|uniref:energy transducer TonB n=1 Tax=Fusobacterium perfoetens TaxID=852 RepID=UPI001F3A6A0C|nr:energy transducer TonB [Fusobacterium perfoetens]
MDINKRDKLSFSLALIINLIIVLLIPGYKIEDVKEGKLKVGLVALEKERVYSKEQKKTVTAKKTVEKKEPVKKNIEIPAPKKQEAKKEKSLSLDSVSKTIKAPSINVISSVNLSARKKSDTLDEALKSTKKELKFEREEKLGMKTEDIKFNDTLVLDETIKERDTSNILIDKDESISIESIKVEEGKVEGLPSGYKLGVEEGDIVARWDSENQEPEYPESAQLKGLQGSVRVKIDVNEKGEVVNLIIDKGSGVPEINSAIESIGRTWKIYLSRHGLSIKGRVILDYTFKLKGN